MDGFYGANDGPGKIQLIHKVHQQTRQLIRFAEQKICFTQLPSKFYQTVPMAVGTRKV